MPKTCTKMALALHMPEHNLMRPVPAWNDPKDPKATRQLVSTCSYWRTKRLQWKLSLSLSLEKIPNILKILKSTPVRSNLSAKNDEKWWQMIACQSSQGPFRKSVPKLRLSRLRTSSKRPQLWSDSIDWFAQGLSYLGFRLALDGFGLNALVNAIANLLKWQRNYQGRRSQSESETCKLADHTPWQLGNLWMCIVRLAASFLQAIYLQRLTSETSNIKEIGNDQVMHCLATTHHNPSQS